MDLMVERCAGVDIGKDEVVACVRTPNPSGKGRRKQTRTFSSFTSQLKVMADWFASEGVTEVVMEATGCCRTGWLVMAATSGLETVGDVVGVVSLLVWVVSLVVFRLSVWV